jgi:hypothetical protein
MFEGRIETLLRSGLTRPNSVGIWNYLEEDWFGDDLSNAAH